MTEQQRPQDPVPPDPGAPPYQAYQPYPAGYPSYPPPYPGYAGYPGYPPPGLAPPSHLGWAIAALVVFWPIGIPAIIKSTQVDRYWMTGQPVLAEQASRTAKTLGVVAVAVAGALVVIWLVMFFVFFTTFADYVPPPR
ncbi:hypothetical protein JOF56_000066 [Kibdelosporangium banguiense]|uniref:Interferon-induced transmembrane protein n=1 Tax=Kibdelosporangium banguiense TaxID=1365924 RepID=A0ABS4T5D5_9PSEU|nr:CD225/dispanin family protein [Kibdelosporangium banguiense]MBP2319681.1 hypothetical protein [Kibdelosporangium banguiense]